MIKITRTFEAEFGELLDNKDIPAIDEFLTERKIPVLKIGFTKTQVDELEAILTNEDYPHGVTEYEYLKKEQRNEYIITVYHHLKNLKVESIKLLISYIKDDHVKQSVQAELIKYKSNDLCYSAFFTIDECINTYRPILSDPYSADEIIKQINTTINNIEDFRIHGSTTTSVEIEINNMISKIRALFSTTDSSKNSIIGNIITATSNIFNKNIPLQIQNKLTVIENTFLDTSKPANPTSIVNPATVNTALFASSRSSPPQNIVAPTVQQNKHINFTMS